MKTLFLYVIAFNIGLGAVVQHPLVSKSLERLERYSWNAEDRHVRDLLKEALEKSELSSLEKPNLVSVSYREEEGRPVEFVWIGSPPGADGVILYTRDGTKWSGTMGFPIRKVDQERNLKSQEGDDAHAICHAVISLETSGVIKVPTSEFVSGQLTLGEEPVSNICKFRNIVVSKEESQIVTVINEHLKYVEDEDLNGVSNTIHPDTQQFQPMITALRDLYQKVDISVKVKACRVLYIEDDMAEVYVAQEVRGVGGEPMQDYRVSASYILKRDNEEWKLWGMLDPEKTNL